MSETGGQGSRASRYFLIAALCGAALYALPVYFPPATTTVAPSSPDAGLLVRLFPGIPAWWVIGRLACLALAMLAAAVAVAPSGAPFRHAMTSASVTTKVEDLRRAWLWAGFAVASASAVASFWAAYFGRVAQLVYVAALAVPPLLLAMARPRSPGRRHASRRPAVVATAAVIAGWLVLRLLATWHSPRAADLVDGWDGLECLAHAARDDFNLLTDACYQGYTVLPLVLQGAGVLGRWLPLRLESVQLVHLAWTAACAAGVASIAGSLLGALSAPVAAAVFLFAPLELMTPMWSAGPFVFSVYATALLAAVLRIERARSAAAVAAFGALAGMACRCPPLVAMVLLLGAAVLWRWRDQRPSALVIATAVALFWAVLGPGLHSALSLGDAVKGYSGGRGSWATMEAAFFGRFSPQLAESVIGAPSTHALDVPLGLLLSPFAIPRTAVRLWGDTLLDPLGAALAALGLAAALRCAPRRADARLLLALLAALLLPGIVSSYDRPSLTRVTAVAVPLSLLAAVGFEVLRTEFVTSRFAVVVATLAGAAIAVSGSALFDVINTKILARSPVGIVLSELDKHRDGGDAAVLDETLWKPRYTRPSAREVPKRPLRVVPFDGLADVIRAPEPPVLFWSPGEEEDYAVSQTICRAWPHAKLYVLSDAAGLTNVFAASHERLEFWQERMRDCPGNLETEASRARHALAESVTLAEAGRSREAAEVLEAQARQTFGYAELFDATARALLAQPDGESAVARAVEWASRACEARAGNDPHFCATLASAHARNGNPEAAILAARRAKDAATRRGDEALAGELEQRIQQYARGASGVSD